MPGLFFRPAKQDSCVGHDALVRIRIKHQRCRRRDQPTPIRLRNWLNESSSDSHMRRARKITAVGRFEIDHGATWRRRRGRRRQEGNHEVVDSVNRCDGRVGAAGDDGGRDADLSQYRSVCSASGIGPDRHACSAARRRACSLSPRRARRCDWLSRFQRRHRHHDGASQSRDRSSGRRRRDGVATTPGIALRRGTHLQAKLSRVPLRRGRRRRARTRAGRAHGSGRPAAHRSGQRVAAQGR